MEISKSIKVLEVNVLLRNQFIRSRGVSVLGLRVYWVAVFMFVKKQSDVLSSFCYLTKVVDRNVTNGFFNNSVFCS